MPGPRSKGLFGPLKVSGRTVALAIAVPLGLCSATMDTPIQPARTRFLLGLVLPSFLLAVLLGQGCASKTRVAPPPGRVIAKPSVRTQAPPVVKHGLPRMGYSIQVGAFARVDNAARLTRSLEARGIEAFYFAHSSGLFKVRFGNYPSWKEAAAIAKPLRASGIIEAYYIVSPGEYVQARGGTPGSHTIRDEIVATAQSFLGLPYQWCDASTNAVLDCSGLALAVYQLNGLNLPRTSAEQYDSGTPVDVDGLQKGDLVFFSDSWFGRISHVGIFIGDGQFIHAPGKGKVIRTESLASSYYQEHYRGGRTYLQ